MAKVSALWKCLLYRESIQKSEVFKSKHEICHIYWMGQKTEKLKLVCLQTRFTTLVHLTTDHEEHL